MDKQHVVYTCKGILFGLEKEGNSGNATVWLKLEGLMLNEISQSQNNSAK